MMMQAHAAMGRPFDLKVLTQSNTDPAARLGGDVHYGDLADVATLRSFFAHCDIVTFESEFHLADLLEEASRGLTCRFVPSLNTLRLTQDKLAQKRLCAENAVPTAAYQPLPADLKPSQQHAWLAETGSALESPDKLVLKWARFGYDGKGTLFWTPATPNEAVERFIEDGGRKGSTIYAERHVPFRRELAQLTVLSTNDELAHYPTVVSEQPGGICKRVYGPATAFGVAEALQVRAQQYATNIGRALPLHGAFALELFEDRHGQLWLNEMAPRVHNSGHFSIDAARCSQFENHLRAICGLPLGDTGCDPAFGMLNLIGDRDRDTPLPPHDPPPEVRVHWYEKDSSRPGRKLGHLNTRADNREQLDEQMAALDQVDGRWLTELEEHHE